jgi:hypothetical protein
MDLKCLANKVLSRDASRHIPRDGVSRRCLVETNGARHLSAPVSVSRFPRERDSETGLGRVLAALESRYPDLVPADRWRAAVEDGRRFLARSGEQAEALGWTARDLFGLDTPPAKPHPSYSRLSRYDATGLIWLLRGRPVIALTEATAAIQNPTGAVTVYRKHNKPALGPLGDSLNDFTAA